MIPQSLIDLLFSENHDDRKLAVIIIIQEYEDPRAEILSAIQDRGSNPSDFLSWHHYYLKKSMEDYLYYLRDPENANKCYHNH